MYWFDFSYDEYNKLLSQCPFSEEEEQIINLKRRGRSNTQICLELCISQPTLSRRIKRIFKKIRKEI